MLGYLKYASSGLYELIEKKFADVFQTLKTNENVKKIQIKNLNKFLSPFVTTARWRSAGMFNLLI